MLSRHCSLPKADRRHLAVQFSFHLYHNQSTKIETVHPRFAHTYFAGCDRDPRQPEIGPRARTNQYASGTMQLESPTCVCQPVRWGVCVNVRIRNKKEDVQQPPASTVTRPTERREAMLTCARGMPE